MANDIVGMLVGAAMDRNKGGSGIKGAIEGTIVEGAVKLILPLAVTFAIGWGVQFALRHGLHAVTGDDDLKRS